MRNRYGLPFNPQVSHDITPGTVGGREANRAGLGQPPHQQPRQTWQQPMSGLFPGPQSNMSHSAGPQITAARPAQHHNQMPPKMRQLMAMIAGTQPYQRG